MIDTNDNVQFWILMTILIFLGYLNSGILGAPLGICVVIIFSTIFLKEKRS